MTLTSPLILKLTQTSLKFSKNIETPPKLLTLLHFPLICFHGC